MNWADFWAPNLVQWLVGGTITALVGLWVRRMVKLQADRIVPILRVAEKVLGANTTTIPVQQKAATMDLRQARKAIAAGFGIILTGLLTWVESSNLEPVLGPLVPEPYRPLVGVILGGLATIASVYLAKNDPATADADVPAAEPAQAVVEQPTAAVPPAIVSAPSLASFAQPTEASPIITTPAVAVSIPAPVTLAASPATNETSIVQLLPAPVGSYL